MSKKSFILHVDSLSVLDEMTDEQAGKLFKAIANFNRDFQDAELDFVTKIAFAPFRNQFTRDAEKYDSFVESQREKGLKSAESRAKNKSNQYQPNQPQLTTVNHGQPNSTESTYSDSDSDSDSDSVSDSKNDSDSNMGEITRKRFSPPSYDEVLIFMKEKNSLAGNIWDLRKVTAEAKNYWNYYEANGWMVGRNKMKKWDAACRKWMNNANNFIKNTNGKQQQQSELDAYRAHNQEILRGAVGQ